MLRQWTDTVLAAKRVNALLHGSSSFSGRVPLEQQMEGQMPGSRLTVNNPLYLPLP
jgi:hypothetical protein